MVFLNIKYWFRKETPEQMLRDDETTTAHNTAVARGEARILATGKDGNLYSYRPEEHGPGRGGNLPLTSVLGHVAWTGVWAFAFMGLGGAFLLGVLHNGMETPRGSDWIGLIVLALMLAAFALFFVLGLRDLIKEIKASRVRKRRGIPRPIG